jgi:SAM-dependent methyltransferase
MDIGELRKNWDKIGRIDPFYSILSDNARRGKRWNTDEFFARGREDIEVLIKEIDALPFPVSRKKALDFGCGAGRLTQALADHFQEVCGVDIAPSMIELARQHNRHGDRCLYFLNENDSLSMLRDGTFDLICSIYTLQHMEACYRESYLREFLRVLAPNGVLFFQLPYTGVRSSEKCRWIGPGVRGKIRALIPRSALKAYRAVRYFRKPEIETYAANNQDVIDFIDSIGGKVLSTKHDFGRLGYLYCVVKR